MANDKPSKRKDAETLVFASAHLRLSFDRKRKQPVVIRLVTKEVIDVVWKDRKEKPLIPKGKEHRALSAADDVERVVKAVIEHVPTEFLDRRWRRARKEIRRYRENGVAEQ